MTIDDKIRNEKLQYDIKKEAAKISTLSSGKIDKYEYLTEKEILPPGQKRAVEQAKFTYSSLGKGFAKQINTNKDQGGKQIKALKEHGKQLVESNALIKRNCYDTENKLPLKEEEIYDRIVTENKNEINNLNNKIEYDKLKYHYKSENRTPISFNSFDLPLGLMRKIKDGSIDLEKAK